jgi:hypothetical protein
MMMVFGRLISMPFVTLEADFVAFPLAKESMGIVAITASHPLIVHRTLQEGVVDINLILDLAVGEIEPLRQLCRQVVITEVIAEFEIIIEL